MFVAVRFDSGGVKLIFTWLVVLK